MIRTTRILSVGPEATSLEEESEPRMDGALHLGGVDGSPAPVKGATVVFTS